MVNTTNPAFQKTPKPFDGIGVDIAADVNLGGVVDSTVGVPCPGEAVVTPEFVRGDNRQRRHLVSDDRHEGPCFDIGCDTGDDLTSAFDYAEDSYFMGARSRTASLSTAFLS